MILGYSESLYLLPFDHRGSFEKGMFGWRGPLTLAETTIVEAPKRIIYAGFEDAIAAGVPKRKAGIVVDEEFSDPILRDAVGQGYIVVYPVEKPGQTEFDFEYDHFAGHIQVFEPKFCKALIRYNPEGNRLVNNLQLDRLKRLSDYLHSESQSLFMLELLVPPEASQLSTVDGDLASYNSEIRPGLMVDAIKDLQRAGVEPDVWSIEGVKRRENCERIIEVARRESRDKVSCIVHGQNHSDEELRECLSIAAPISGYIGFALGHDFWEPLWRWRAKTIPREVASRQIADRFRGFVDFFENASAR